MGSRLVHVLPYCMCEKEKAVAGTKKAKSGGTRTPSFNHQGKRKVPGVLHQPIHQAYKAGLKLGLTRPITASTVACAAGNKPYP